MDYLGQKKQVELIYHKNKYGNFGDDLNDWMWDKYFPGLFDGKPDIAVIGIGTLLGTGAIRATPLAKKRIVFGTGSGYSSIHELDATWDVRFVRGPRTAKMFGLNSSKAITDPAILTSQFVDNPDKEFEVSFIPHHSSLFYGDWSEVCEHANINLIDPRCDGRKVIDVISKSEVVLAESMHGAIVADSLRVPWIPVSTSNHILKFKWLDWAESMNLNIEMDSAPRIVRPITSYTIDEQIKNYTKMALQSLKFRKFDVIRPIIGSSKSEKIQAAKKLIEISTTSKRNLSKDSVFEDRLNAVLVEIDKFRDEYLSSSRPG